MNAQPPVRERALPEESSTRIRAAIMAGTVARRPVRRVTDLLVAAAVVLLLVGVGFAVWTRAEQGVVAAPLPPVSTYGDRVVTTDRGPLTEAQTTKMLALCVRREDPAVREIISARRLSDGHTAFPWVVYRNADGQVVLCSKRLTGPTYAGERKFRPSTRYPVVPVGGMNEGGWTPDQSTASPTTATGYSTSQFFAAGPQVATVQLRVVVEGVPGAWFTGEVHAGYVYVPLFEPGPVPLDPHGEPKVSFERRALDFSGSPVTIK